MDKTPQIYVRSDFEAGVRAAWLDTAVRRCPTCAARNCWDAGRCSGCGTNQTAAFLCPECERLLESISLDYEARGSGGNRLVKATPGHQCSSCSTVFTYEFFIKELDEFIESVPRDLQIIPEVGIQTSGDVEVFVTVVGGIEVDSECEVASVAIKGLRAAVGKQSDLFKKCLYQVSDYVSDFCSDSSLTLHIHPGPPYDVDHRREIQILLSHLCRSGLGSLRFWSLDFEPPWQDESSLLLKLGRILEKWPVDDDRVCLALVNNIAAGLEPSKFVNAFRLVETLVNRLLERRVQEARFNRSVDHSAFLRLVRLLQADLKTRLREVAKGKTGDATPILKKLWRVLEPGRGYNQDEIFDRLARVRNYSVHGPADEGEAIMLPWEVKPLGQIAEHVLELAVFLIEESPAKTSQ